MLIWCAQSYKLDLEKVFWQFLAVWLLVLAVCVWLDGKERTHVR